MTRKYWIVFVAIIAVVVVALAGVIGWRALFSADRRLASLAERIDVHVPDSATRIEVDAPRFAVQGNCSSLEFLMPEGEWEAYVAQYFARDQLSRLSSVPGFCGHALIDCDAGIYVKGFVASARDDRIRRSMEIIPDCIDGLARIAWGTTD